MEPIIPLAYVLKFVLRLSNDKTLKGLGNLLILECKLWSLLRVSKGNWRRRYDCVYIPLLFKLNTFRAKGEQLVIALEQEA